MALLAMVEGLGGNVLRAFVVQVEHVPTTGSTLSASSLLGLQDCGVEYWQ